MVSPVQLGLFDLVEQVGKGGMGAVWRGTLRGRERKVAVKVLTSATARDPRRVELFRNEVRAVAGLDHPNVVVVFDYGSVTAHAAKRSYGELVEGSPYLVMEWAGNGSLLARRPQTWDGVRDVLLCVLDALAHAHARGVVHRDLKPDNVLVADDGRLMLADFGIARLREDAGSESVVAMGTVSYMAPEQVLGRLRNEGPWTDLYALGCLSHWLLGATPPFTGRPKDVMEAHLFQPPPRPTARFPLPVGFATWVATLLEKSPSRRFRHAADAAAGLLRLPAPPETEASQVTPAAPSTPPQTVTLSITGSAWGASPESAPAEAGTEPDDDESIPIVVGFDSATERAHHDAPAWPESWRPAQTVEARFPLNSVGLGLFGLRSIPLSGREAERDRLWATLSEVVETTEPRAVLLTGAAGTGKSRLARWIAERASEVGVASPLFAVHDEDGGPHVGLAPMLRRAFRCEGLDANDAAARVRRELSLLGWPDDPDALPLGAWLAGDETVVRFARPRERYELAARCIGRLADERPIVCVLDDVHHGEESLAFVRHALDRADGGPVLFVLTSVDEALTGRPAEQDLVDEVRTHPRTTHAPIGPLSSDDAARLVRGLLGLEGTLAAGLEERVAGNPLFAVQLVGDWVQRGVLEPGDRGFQLRFGALADLPDDLHALWAARMSDLVTGATTEAVRTLEVASLLGLAVEPSEWEAACDELKLPPAWDLVEALLDRSLAHASERGARAGWSFAHAMLRETLERRAADEGGVEDLHRGCARMLSTRSGPTTEERLGRHLLGAGAVLEAAGPLLAGAVERIERGELRAAAALLDRRDQALDGVGITRQDPLRGEGRIAAARVENRRGGDRADAMAAAALADARRFGWNKLLPRALTTSIHALVKRGELEWAAQQCAEARGLASKPSDVGAAAYWSGIVAQERGELDEARVFMEEAHRRFADAGERIRSANCLYELGGIHRRSGRHELAAEHLARAAGRYEGYREGVANAKLVLGDVERDRGRLDAAEDEYRSALAIYEAIGSGNEAIARLNLGLSLLARGRHSDARSVLEAALARLEEAGWRALVVCAHVELMACAAGERDWQAWDSHWEAVAADVRSGPNVDPDLAWSATLAADLAHYADEPERASELYALALRQWRALGRDDEADRIEPRCRPG